MRYKPLVALVLLVLMLLVPLSTGFAQSTERTKIDYDHRGPMQGLRKLAGVDPRLVYALEDEKGNKIDPKKVRRLSKDLYLPKGVTLDISKYKQFRDTELRAYGRLQATAVRRHRRANRQIARNRGSRKSGPSAKVIPPKAPVVELLGPSGKMIVQPGANLTYTVVIDGKEVVKRSVTLDIEKPKPADPAVATGTLAGAWATFQATAGPLLRQVMIVLLWVILIVATVVLATQIKRAPKRAWRARRERKVEETYETYKETSTPPVNRRDFGPTGSTKQETVRTTKVETQPDPV